MSFSRLKEVRIALDLSQKQMAKDLGVSQVMIQNYEHGRNPISDTFLIKLRNKYSVNLTWMTYGTGEMFLDTAPRLMFRLPYYKEVSISPKNGKLICDDDKIQYMQFPTALIKVTDDNELAVIKAEGDSMAPMVNHGDYVVLDFKRKTLSSEGLYVIHIDDTIMVKKLQKLPSGVNVISENSQYKPIKLTKEQFKAKNVAVIGRVVFVIKNFVEDE